MARKAKKGKKATVHLKKKKAGKVTKKKTGKAITLKNKKGKTTKIGGKTDSALKNIGTVSPDPPHIDPPIYNEVADDIVWALSSAIESTANSISDSIDKIEGLEKEAVEVWVYPEDALGFQFPVTPDAYKVTQSNGNQTVNLLSAGDTTLIGTPKKASIEFSSFFPSSYWHGCAVSEDNFLSPYDYVKVLNNLAKTGEVLRLTIVGTDVDYDATITEFEHEEKDGTGDVYYSIKFETYPHVSRRTVKKKATTATTTPATPVTYTVQKGDTVYKISKKVYGDGKYAGQIYTLNSKTIEAIWTKWYNKQKAIIKKWNRQHPHNKKEFTLDKSSKKGKHLVHNTVLTLTAINAKANTKVVGVNGKKSKSGKNTKKSGKNTKKSVTGKVTKAVKGKKGKK